jgi:hypothetical protein
MLRWLTCQDKICLHTQYHCWEEQDQSQNKIGTGRYKWFELEEEVEEEEESEGGPGAWECFSTEKDDEHLDDLVPAGGAVTL